MRRIEAVLFLAVLVLSVVGAVIASATLARRFLSCGP